MPYYSDNLIEDVLSSNDIVSVISEYVNLTKRGRNHIGLCPFHREKTPSFCVSMDKQIFKCFGCGEGGNVIHFITKIENLDFHDAIEHLAEKAGLDLDKYVTKTAKGNINTKQIRSKKDILFNICKTSAKFYHENLMLKLENKNSLEYNYMKKRNLSIDTLVKFGIGLSDSKRPLYNHLLEQGYDKKDILDSGIIVENDKGKIYDRFFNRLIFPILDIRDRVIAFGGRVFDDSLPKYLNSPENLIYHKGKTLYLLNFAKKEKLDKIIIVEGYMDAVSLQRFGYNNVVASLGTALTNEQARLIKNYTDNVIIAYDQDSAGEQATMRGLDILSSKGLNVKVLKLDDEKIKDPDEYVNKLGTHKLDKCIDKSISLVEYKVSKFEKDLNLQDITSKIKFLNNVASVLSKITNNIEREVYIDRFSDKYNLSKASIEKEVNKKLKNITENFSKVSITDIYNKSISSLSKDKKIEQHIIALLLCKKKHIVNKIFDNFKKEDFNIFGEIYVKLLNLNKECDITKIDILSKFEDKEEIQELSHIFYLELPEDKDRLLDELIKINEKFKYSNRKKQILDKLKENISEDEKIMLKNELSGIMIMLSKLK